MKREKFPKDATLLISGEEALNRALGQAHRYSGTNSLKKKEVQDAIRIIHKEVGLLRLLDFWPKSEVYPLLMLDLEERYNEIIVERVVRHIFAEQIPNVIVKKGSNQKIHTDSIMVLSSEAEVDGYGCETGWFYFDFAVFNDPTNYRDVAFSGTFKTSIDVLDATVEELQTWLYAREWEFESVSLEELYKKYNEK